MVVASPDLAKIEQLRFFDTKFFRAGEIHNHLPVWERLLSGHSSPQVSFIDIVWQGVKIDRFSSRLKETSRVARTTRHVHPLYSSAILRFVKDLKTLFPRLCLSG